MTTKIDGNRFAIPIEMKKYFEQQNLWETFLSESVKAFRILRKNHELVVACAKKMFSHCGFDSSKIEIFFTEEAFYLHRNEERACGKVKKRLESGASSWKKRLKDAIHVLESKKTE